MRQNPADRAAEALALEARLLPEPRSIVRDLGWRLWPTLAAVAAALIAVANFASHASERRARATLLADHATMTAPIAPAYLDARAAIERHTLAAVGRYEGDYVAPGFSMRDLARGPVLYGRVRAGEVLRTSEPAASLRRRYADAVGTCLGIEVDPVHQMLSRGDVLTPAWAAQAAEARGADRLGYLRQDMLFRVRRDAAALSRAARRRYFVLAVDEAALSIDGPTRVYAYDMRTGQLLLRARGGEATATLVPVRIAGMPGGGSRVPASAEHLTLPLHDCAVAAAVRERLGAGSDPVAARAP